jgi:hypothetical protein
LFGWEAGYFQSWAIRWWTNRLGSWKPWRLAKVSHVAPALWLRVNAETKPRLCVIEAIGSGVRVIPLSWLVENYHGAMYHRPLVNTSGLDGEQVVAKGVELWGSAYPPVAEQYTIMALPWLRKLLHKLGWSTDVDKNKYFCSEFCATSYIRAGFPSILPAHECAPIDVYSWCIFGQETLIKD